MDLFKPLLMLVVLDSRRLEQVTHPSPTDEGSSTHASIKSIEWSAKYRQFKALCTRNAEVTSRVDRYPVKIYKPN